MTEVVIYIFGVVNTTVDIFINIHVFRYVGVVNVNNVVSVIFNRYLHRCFQLYHHPLQVSSPELNFLLFSKTSFDRLESNNMNLFSRRFPPKCANHIHSQCDYTELINRFWCLFFADWPERKIMNCFFHFKVCSPCKEGFHAFS